MNNQYRNLEPRGSGGGASDPGSLAGKGWDILVGGKDNAAAAGDDPFDIAKPPLSAVEGTTTMSRDAETDSIMQPGVEPTPTPGVREASPEVLPADLGSAGVSAGVVVTPVGAPAPTTPGITATPMSSNIIETEGGAASPGAPGIVEVAPATPAPVILPPIPSVPAPRMIPAPMNVSSPAPIPNFTGVSGFSVSAPFEVSDPFATQGGMRIFADEKDLAPNADLENQLVTTRRVDALWDDISDTYNMVVNDVRGHYRTTEQALSDLREARELLLAGKENFDNAEQLLYSVKSRLRLEEKVRQWSRTQGVWLGTYLVLWLLLLSLGSTATNKIVDISSYFKLPDWMPETYLPALTGALGGVVGALWVLITHTTRKRDFDPIHTLWYAANPFMGGALGVVTYFIVRGGGGLATSVLSGGADFKLSPEVALTLYAVCIVVGFNQNILWALIDRFVKTIFPQKEEDNKAATDVTPPPAMATVTATATAPAASAAPQGK